MIAGHTPSLSRRAGARFRWSGLNVVGPRIVFSALLSLSLLLGWQCGSASAAAAASDGAGIEHVAADAEFIRLRCRPGDASLEVAEVAPFRSALASNALVVASQREEATRRRIPRFDGARDRLYSSFILVRSNTAASTSGAGASAEGIRCVGTNRYVEQFDRLAKFVHPFPRAQSKKGLQVQMLDDALKLGVKHASLNVNLTGLVDAEARATSLPWNVDGSPIHFRRGAIEGLDRQVRTLTDAGVVVTFILLTYASGNEALDRRMLHPRYDPKAPNRLGAFNAETAEGVRYLRGTVEFLAHRYSDPAVYGGRVANYILGNEVNSHWFWSNMGRVTMTDFAESHLRAARIVHTALRTASSSARLYLSLEHHWGIRYPGGDASQAFAGRPFLEYFNRRAREQGDFGWHLAFHPYPENLFEPRTWKDKSATTNASSPRITFKNLPVLMRFLEQPAFQWEGQARRVILSEQGFHTVDGPNGELWQAAAYAYAYYQVDQIPGIDAFILHRHVDHGQEGGLRLGLWSRDEASPNPAAPKAPKRIYELFRAADTAEWEKAAAFALPVIGIERWSDVLR
jgi:hypothetical protein